MRKIACDSGRLWTTPTGAECVLIRFTRDVRKGRGPELPAGKRSQGSRPGPPQPHLAPHPRGRGCAPTCGQGKALSGRSKAPWPMERTRGPWTEGTLVGPGLRARPRGRWVCGPARDQGARQAQEEDVQARERQELLGQAFDPLNQIWDAQLCPLASPAPGPAQKLRARVHPSPGTGKAVSARPVRARLPRAGPQAGPLFW